MRAVVTGGAGFAGSHLVERLVESGAEVVAWAAPGESEQNLASCLDRIRLVRGDLRDKQACRTLLKDHAPDVLFHLAAVSFLPDAESDPAALFAINVGGTVNLIRAIAAQSPATRMIHISSAEVYGRVPPERMPMTESQPVRPANLYAFSKAFSENLVLDAMARSELDAVICRPFTHIGPRQSPKFAASGFARQIARIEKGQADPVIKVGNLEARRDLIDVKDMARAYTQAADGAIGPGPFNIGSGQAVRIREVLDILMSMATVSLTVEVDSARLRPLDIPIYAGDPGSFHAATGWLPEIKLEDSLRALLDWWRSTH